jgi:DNA mismatch repair protein MutL
MGIIHLLDNFTANSIAAGEVVERPSSVVKELIENALDAGASVISIEIRQGGISMIRVSDNGCGFQPDDAKMAFLRHSTSKITNIDDLQNLQTMGFRGEALASIAAVSEITLESRQPGSEEGIRLKLSAGEIIQESVSACPAGTVIQVDNLFFNQPARYKFLKKDQTEASYITDLIERLALGRPDISFRLINHDREIIHTPGNDDLMMSSSLIY